jgi:multiple sugar transport system permease protein
MRTENLARKVFFYLVISLIGIFALLPFLWMVSTSLKARESIYAIPIQWIPREPSLEAYRAIFTLGNINFFRSLMNSFYVAALLTILPLLSSAMAAFVFAKIEFRGRELLFGCFIFTMMIPGAVTMIPNFITLRNMGLLNSYSALVLPALCNPLAIFFIRQFIRGINNSYMEAAVMDGASLFLVFRMVILPLAKPVLFTMGLFNFMGAWNGFLWPLVVLTNRSKWTLQLALANLGSQFYNYQHYLMAGALISIIPIIIVYLISQRFVEEGLSAGGIKG